MPKANINYLPFRNKKVEKKNENLNTYKPITASHRWNLASRIQAWSDKISAANMASAMNPCGPRWSQTAFNDPRRSHGRSVYINFV